MHKSWACISASELIFQTYPALSILELILPQNVTSLCASYIIVACYFESLGFLILRHSVKPAGSDEMEAME